MFCNREPIILASGSPRRKSLLQQMGLEFTVVQAAIVETRQEGEPADCFVRRMALEKGEKVSSIYPDAWVISGDTVVCLGETILGKPLSSEDAVNLLMCLSGREHVVRTGYSIGHRGRGVSVQRSIATTVAFAEFSEIAARSYVATGEPLDKAGAYGIQGKGAVLVRSIQGSYSNVVGLPLREVMNSLDELGVVELC